MQEGEFLTNDCRGTTYFQIDSVYLDCISIRINGEGRVMIDVRQFRRSVPVLDVWE